MDDVEAGAVTLVHTASVALTISIAAPAGIEGTAPIWADLDGDGRREISGRLSSNLATVTLASGRMAVGAGRDDGVLRIWVP